MELIGFGLEVAILAVYWFVAARLKRDFCLFTTLGASRGEHLARASIVKATTFIPETFCPSSRTTGRTTLGLIGKAFGCKELLLTNGKRERFSTIGTLK